LNFKIRFLPNFRHLKLSSLQNFKMEGDNLNMQNVIGDLKKNIQEKKYELYRFDANIADHERKLQILDVSIKEKTETKRDLSTKLAGATSTLESVNKRRDDKMMLHSNLLRNYKLVKTSRRNCDQRLTGKLLNVCMDSPPFSIR